ncbi:AtpZ/AtpI family protein [Chloroflexota bacterium]
MMKWVAALRLTGVGFFVGGSIVLGVVAGRWLDGKLDSEPIWTIVGLILGIVVAFYGIYTMLRPFIDKTRNKGDS